MVMSSSDDKLLTAEAELIFEDLLAGQIMNEIMWIHRTAKVGYWPIIEAEDRARRCLNGEDVSGDVQTGKSGNKLAHYGVITGNTSAAAQQHQVECMCPECHKKIAGCRFAPHLAKCMGFGRNSSRQALRRIAEQQQQHQLAAQQQQQASTNSRTASHTSLSSNIHDGNNQEDDPDEMRDDEGDEDENDEDDDEDDEDYDAYCSLAVKRSRRSTAAGSINAAVVSSQARVQANSRSKSGVATTAAIIPTSSSSSKSNLRSKILNGSRTNLQHGVATATRSAAAAATSKSGSMMMITRSNSDDFMTYDNTPNILLNSEGSNDWCHLFTTGGESSSVEHNNNNNSNNNTILHDTMYGFSSSNSSVGSAHGIM